MANFVKAHGLTLAANGYVQNMVVEAFGETAHDGYLAEPSSPSDAGRIWFNVDLKAFRVTQLTALGAVVKKTLATDQDLQQYISDVASQTEDTSGASLVGYDGNGGALDNFNLSAGPVDAALDAIATSIDTVIQTIIDLGSGSLTDIQTEVDAIQTVIGAMYDSSDDPDGVFLAPIGTNYISDGGTITSLTAAFLALDSQLYATDGVADAALPLAGGTMTGNITMSGSTNFIHGLGNPTADTDAANKAYVDAMAQGLSPKAAVKAATLGPITLTGAQTIDGVSVIAGDRVLVKDQGSSAVSEVSKIAFVGATPAGLGGKYCTLDSTTTAYYVWFDLDDGSSDPNVADKTGIPVDIATGDTAAQIAGKVQVVLEAHSAFGATVDTTDVTITNTVAGVATNAGAGDSGLTASTLTQGAAAGNAATNGIYIAATGAWARSGDTDGTPVGEVITGMYVYVEGGTQEATGWALTTANPIVVGTSALTFVQFSSAGLVIAGTGLHKAGNVLSVNLGAGIYEGPSGEVGVEVFASGGLHLVSPDSPYGSSSATNAVLSIKLDGVTLQLGANGLSVAAAATSGIENEVDAIETALGSYYNTTTDLYEAPETGTNYLSASTSFSNALYLLDDAIDDEYDRAKGIEDAIITACGLTVATGVLPDWYEDAVYVTGMASLKLAIEALDVVANDIQTEVNNIETATGLSEAGELPAWYEDAVYVTGMASLKLAIEALDAQVGTNASSLYKVTTTTPATQFNIAHSLGSQDVAVNVWVADPNDGNKFKNDLVGITITGNNNIQIDLTESRNIKVLVEAFA